MKTYLVGGAVRDQLLGRPVRDRDWVLVGAREEDLRAQGFRRLDTAFPVYLHPDTGEEYALARRERKIGPGYKGFAVEAGPDVTLEEDLIRRDFRINAMALDEAGQLIDPWEGRVDLTAGLLRHISPAFVEDPVRLLRAARFSAQLGFEPVAETWALLEVMAGYPELTTLLPERFRDELAKALATDRPGRFIKTLHRCGALARLLPPLAAALGPAQALEGDAPLPLVALGRAPAAPAARLAALLTPALTSPNQGDQLARELGFGRAERDLLVLSLRWPAARLQAADAQTLLGLLEQIRAFSHPGRLDDLLALWQALDPERGTQAAARARSALAAAQAVDVQALVQVGWIGAELGRRLRAARLDALGRLTGMAAGT